MATPIVDIKRDQETEIAVPEYMVRVDGSVWAVSASEHHAAIIQDALIVMFKAVAVIANRTNSNAVKMDREGKI